jgi:four helix bundle protein
MIQSYRDLQVWQKGMDIVVQSYNLATVLPSNELYGLTSQIRRAAIAIPANIAEGAGRDHIGDYLRHLSIAAGSLTELETHILIGERLQYFSPQDIGPLLNQTAELGRMLTGLTKKLKARRSSQQAPIT